MPELRESQMQGSCVVPTEAGLGVLWPWSHREGVLWTRNLQVQPPQPNAVAVPAGDPVGGCRMNAAPVALAGALNLVIFNLKDVQH